MFIHYSLQENPCSQRNIATPINNIYIYLISTLILLVLELEYSVINRSIPWILKPWLRVSSRHQKPWNWLCSMNGLCLTQRSISTIGVMSVLSNYRKYKYNLMFQNSNNNINGLMQDCGVFIALAMEILSSICHLKSFHYSPMIAIPCTLNMETSIFLSTHFTKYFLPL